MSKINYLAIKAELVAGHPVTGAYNADNQLAADELNLVNIDLVRASITGAEFFRATSGSEFNGLTAEKKSEWLSFCGITDHTPETNGVAHKFLQYIFGASSSTEVNLVAVRKETVSRKSQLGISFQLGVDHIAYARALA